MSKEKNKILRSRGGNGFDRGTIKPTVKGFLLCLALYPILLPVRKGKERLYLILVWAKWSDAMHSFSASEGRHT